MARLQPLKTHRRNELLPIGVVAGLSLLALTMWGLRDRDAPPPLPPVGPVRAPAPPPPPKLVVPPLTGKHLSQLQFAADGSATLPIGSGTSAQVLSLTLDGAVQQAIQAQVDRTKVPYAAIVIIDIKTGALRAVVESRQDTDPVAAIGSLTEPNMPAASVFKVVSTAAMLKAGKSPTERVCFHGGRHGIDVSNLRDHPADHQCETLTEALAHSTNSAFAKFAVRDLQAGDLTAMATAMGFSTGFASDFKVTPSLFAEGDSELSRARAAPGFAGSTLSPLHAAWMVALIGNDGVAMRPYLVTGSSAAPGIVRQPESLGQVLPADLAQRLRTMMVATTESGTGRKSFSKRPRSLQGIAVAGKTGSLSGQDPATYRHFSWFVGIAPADHPEVAVAAVAINGLKWRVKGPVLARDALGVWFARGKHKDAEAVAPAVPADQQGPVDSEDDGE